MLKKYHPTKYKLLLILILGSASLCPLTSTAQEYLGQSRQEIGQFMRQQNKGQAVPGGDTLLLKNQEEDELGRIFDTEYTFILTQEKCTEYTKRVPLHTYWINRIRELSESQDAKGSGQEIKFESETIFPIYEFEDYTLYIRSENHKLSLRFLKH